MTNFFSLSHWPVRKAVRFPLQLISTNREALRHPQTPSSILHRRNDKRPGQTSPAHVERAGLKTKPAPRSVYKVTASVKPGTQASARQLPLSQRTKCTIPVALGNLGNNVVTHRSPLSVHLECTPANNSRIQ